MKKLKKFSNGLTLVYQYVPTVHSVATGIFVRAGSVNENSKNNGISHFFGAYVLQGHDEENGFRYCCGDR
jgi:Predicted Zn-dependent peptidases